MMKMRVAMGVLFLCVLLAGEAGAAKKPGMAQKTSGAEQMMPKPASSAQGTFGENLKHAYVRGAKNIVSSPLEIFIGVRDAKKTEKPCPAGGHYLAGAVRGVGKGFLRLGSGAWDLVAGCIPGHQEGMPVCPQTLF